MKRRTKRNYHRLPLQWTIVALLAWILIRPVFDAAYVTDVETYCPLGGMQAFGSLLVNNSLACNMSETQIFLGLALLVGVLAFSKLFCSHVCPIGTFTEWLGRFGERRKMRLTITGLPDRLLRVLKYALMFVTFYFTVEASELFCRTFDPYYAVLTGFSGDVVLWYAIPAIIITVLGSIFIRQFWCKYLCPLGAASNLFMNAGIFGVVILAGILLPLFHVTVNWVWVLLVLAIAGFIVEAVRMRSWLVPGVHVTRNVATCTDCLKCDKACPMGIKVTATEVVDHIDCHLCGDCIGVCREKDTMGLNKRRMRWLPPAATVVLAMAGILFASRVELPTIDITWGPADRIASASVYEQTGLKSIKCFGSSRSFAATLQEVPGILGVKAYARSHSVKILYDPSIITPEEIRRHIFTPLHSLVAIPAADATIAIVEMGVDRLFDRVDMNTIIDGLSQVDGVYSIETEYGEPVNVRVSYDPSRVNADALRDRITNPPPAGDGTMREGFPVSSTTPATETITGLAFRKEIFAIDSTTCNDYQTFDAGSLAILKVPFEQGLEPEKAEMIPYLVSHLSNDAGVVRVDTRFPDAVPELWVFYVSAKTNVDNIRNALKSPVLSITYESGDTEDVENPFQF